ncbi:hypothetical protein BD770DRAFT_168035 [Pilaira anomala]|nr:hypothetical protein BD770DRAFT_168035 [Pilaira anomala]
MQMTNDNDFKTYGIRKEKDCRRLSLCAQSIRRTSFSSISSTDDGISSDDSPVMLPSPINTAGDTTPHLPPPLLSLKPQTEYRKQSWPNSIHISSSQPHQQRRHSAPCLAVAAPPHYDHTAQLHTNEPLPDYSCTVQKVGKARSKIEFKRPGIKPRFRTWKEIHLELQGTILKVYEIIPDTAVTAGRYRVTPFYQAVKHHLILTLSMAHLKAELATDYKKRDHVFRIITAEGPQLLIQVQTRAAVYGWLDKLASASNIAVNLEDQRMPTFQNFHGMDPLQGSSAMTRSLYQRYLNEERRNANIIESLI